MQASGGEHLGPGPGPGSPTVPWKQHRGVAECRLGEPGNLGLQPSSARDKLCDERQCGYLSEHPCSLPLGEVGH